MIGTLVIGAPVRVTAPSGKLRGEVVEFTPSGLVKVKLSNGTCKTFAAYNVNAIPQKR
ncbi:hypothetical protein FAES_3207 [Fibrella aestuarina BUZ 2]|uniref:KOW domain-containing protein n=1 Tax=Fibrella aestuarina BUZ 2 TaxID=1166018 RepID=I0KAR3_9BACT|nr:hypothetical protein [Fibrella aestuarina]CCH01216.1 hypothetical protein FAES_3207 [Fibrella aestuarina BUZ 2]